MKSKSITIGAFLSVVLVVTAAGLYWMANKSTPGNHQLSISILRNIQQLESQWSVETARVRSDPLSDFDALTIFIPQMEQLKAALLEAMRGIPDLPERLLNNMNAYLSAIDAKEERIERFKTGYAILRNSVRYLPLAASSVMQQVQQRGGEPAFIRNISSVTDEINMYLSTPAPPEKERLMRVLAELGSGMVARYPVLANPIANFVAHGQVLLDKQAPTEAFFQEATSNAITDFGKDLITGLKSEIDKKETLVTYYERGIMATGGALWLMWLAIALRLPKNATKMEESPAIGDAAASTGLALVMAQRANSEQGATKMEEPAAPSGPAAPMDSPPLPAHSEQAESLEKLTALLQAKAQPHGGTSSARASEATSHRIGLEVVAKQLATSVERINTSLDILNEMQGRLHSAITHDQPTPPELTGLTGLTGSSDGNELDNETEVAAVAEEIKTAAAVMSSLRAQANGIVEIAQRLPSFSKEPDAGYAPMDINDYIDEVVESTQAETVALVVKELNPIPEVFASEAEISLILTNVIENCVQAVQEGGQKKGVIRIETRQEDEEVLVTITDNGVGIAPEKHKKVFNPFYTSRDNAMGMGLTATQYLVQKYRGSIVLNSLPGRGTLVGITLPSGASSKPD
jgi:signal transduction histidine kinase